MKKYCFLIVMILLYSSLLFPQVAINTDGSAPDGSSMLDIKSTERGFLLPRMTQAQIESISNPANGLLVFCTDDSKMYIYSATLLQWKEVALGSGIILPPFSCGSPMTINHIAGSVAPVNKTVTYGTVTNIPGEPTKCWITSNLGADHQATAVNDATEASAGWYWQFNRSQGYKHDGSTRTPNTSWINSIDENSDWLMANDPCNLLLGSGWRIPSATEWYNVILSGNWTDWNDPWNSVLKMHAAGYLWDFIYERGSLGQYWSNAQGSNLYGWMPWFYNSGIGLDMGDKAGGNTIRCLKNLATAELPTVITTSVTNVGQTAASSGGEVTSDGGTSVTARGVCWSTASNPTIADDYTTDGEGTGVFESSITGLSPNTPYFLRAYATNSVGTAYGNEESFTTLSGSSCGSPMTINHFEGSVAPVNKTVTYGTVTNIPGEPTKCWITSNLGADHQASAVDDATEASAGWYWQFNRSQGYKHDGSTRTPNTSWISSIDENSDWLMANDPCDLLLGSGWRIPSATEWYNVILSGNWTDWNGPWNSVLKIHAAGYLWDFIYERGSLGQYWSNAQGSNLYGWMPWFFNSGIGLDMGDKTSGNTIRCLKNLATAELPTVITTSVTNVGQTTASSGGEVTSDGGASVTARGVCWSTASNPTIADDYTTDGEGTGVFESSITGLSPNTPYFLRAYATNSVGTAYGNEESFTTLSGSSCGSQITIDHIAGTVAPVTKTVTYGTVTNIPGEPTKCWITSNLGADHQASAVDDATEASAGWYWQFNRMQGYKHDGTTRTPNTTWISSIIENSNWLSSNDPCTLLLGGGWRLPTSQEWFNVDMTAGWQREDDIWASDLKMHSAGRLYYMAGELSVRGTSGHYWSSSQNNTVLSHLLYFNDGDCYLPFDAKTYGFSIRCLKD